MPTEPKEPSELYRLIWRNDVDGVRRALKNGADLNARDTEGRTPLIEAVLRGTDSLVELLILEGADVNVQDHGGLTALHFAAQKFRLVAAEALLCSGAKIDPRDRYGNTPLWTALFNSLGKGEMIRLLLNHGADPASKNNNGKSPIDVANIVANYDLKQYFIKEDRL